MNKVTRFTYLLLFVIIGLSACSQKEQADKLFFNGKIYAVDEAFSVYEAIAIKDDKIIAIGEDSDLLSHYDATEIIDLQGLAVYPGFIDGHTHFLYYAKGLDQVDLSETTSFDEVIGKVQAYEKSHPNNKWIVGFGWDESKWSNPELPNKDTLDTLFPNKILALSRVDGHSLLTNSNGLAEAGFNYFSKIERGAIGKEGRQLTGILVDAAASLLISKAPKISTDKTKQLLQTAEKNCFAVGLTSLAEAGLEKSEVELLDQMHKDNALQMRIYAMLSPTKENIQHYFSSGHYKTKHLSVRSFKIFGDGALGSRGAALLSAYSDAEDLFGSLLGKHNDFDTLIADLSIKNFQVNTHAIGDSAVRYFTNVYGKYLKGTNDKRWRIEHAQVIHPMDLPKFGRYNILPSVQPSHALSDSAWNVSRLGQERISNAYRYQTLLKENNKLILGSDFPVEPIDPLRTFYAAVSQTKADRYYSEKLSRKEALKAMTIWAAYGQFEENEKGSLSPGKLADFIILDQDIMEVEEDKLLNTKVMYTYLGGKKVYELN